MFEGLLLFSLFCLSVSILIAFYRLIKGESMPDRVLALDTIGYHMLAIVAVFSVLLHTQAFLEVILLIGSLAFIGTISLCKFIEKGVVIEHRRDE